MCQMREWNALPNAFKMSTLEEKIKCLSIIITMQYFVGHMSLETGLWQHIGAAACTSIPLIKWGL